MMRRHAARAANSEAVDLDVGLGGHAGLDEEGGDGLAVVALELDDAAELLVLHDDPAAAELPLEVPEDPGVVVGGAQPLHRGQRLLPVALLHAEVHYVVLGRHDAAVVAVELGVREGVERREQAAADAVRRRAGHELVVLLALAAGGLLLLPGREQVLLLGRRAALALAADAALTSPALLRRLRRLRAYGDGTGALLLLVGRGVVARQPPPLQREPRSSRRRRRLLGGLGLHLGRRRHGAGLQLGRRHVCGCGLLGFCAGGRWDLLVVGVRCLHCALHGGLRRTFIRGSWRRRRSPGRGRDRLLVPCAGGSWPCDAASTVPDPAEQNLAATVSRFRIGVLNSSATIS